MNSLPYKCHCEAVFAEAIPYIAGISPQKRDCHAAKEQERRLVMTSIYEMYGREIMNKQCPQNRLNLPVKSAFYSYINFFKHQ
jgi:hypothetical protein